MNLQLLGAIATILAAAIAMPALAGPALETINGIVGGAGGRCASFVPAAELGFFSFAPADVPVCGITVSGYTGVYRAQTATGGTLTQHDSLAPVVLGPPQTSPGFYSGTADAQAQFGSLGVAAHSEISAPGTYGTSTALFDSVAAATFADTLTATSPLMAAGSAGTVRYTFTVDGSLGAPGAVAPATPGDARLVLDLQHDAGPVFEVMNASVRRGELGLVSNRPPPAGWSTGTGTGSLSGGSTFSQDMNITWGQAWDLKVGLLAWSYGTADTLFLHTARLTGIELFDAQGVAVGDFSLLSASGTDYVHAVPEPAPAMLLLAGLAALRLRSRLVGRRTAPSTIRTGSVAERRMLALLLGAAACGAQADTLTFTFEGSLTQDPFGLSQLGAPVSGRFSFDSSAVDDIANPTQGSYTSLGAAFGFSAVVGGVAYTTPGMLNIGTQAGTPGAYLVTGVAGDLTLELVLRDDTGLAVGGDAMPLAAPALDAFAVREFRLFAPEAEFAASLQRLQGPLNPVPEPAPASLLLAGLAALAARRIRLPAVPLSLESSMRPAMPTLIRLLAVCAALASVQLAHAVDGAIRIDQNRALAGNVTPGDKPGFPVTISQPGSYRLAGNLTLPPGVTAIEVTASDVTVDLNGFALIGLPGDPRVTSAVVLLAEGSAAFGLQNGSIVGFGGPLNPQGPAGPLALSMNLERLTVRMHPGQGPATLFVTPNSRVDGVRGIDTFLLAYCPVVVVNSVFQQISLQPNPSLPRSNCSSVGNATSF